MCIGVCQEVVEENRPDKTIHAGKMGDVAENVGNSSVVARWRQQA
jgi:hypothetical protein